MTPRPGCPQRTAPNTPPTVQPVTDTAEDGTEPYSGLDATDLRAAYFCVAHVVRWRPESPPSLRRLLDKLDTAIRTTTSPPRHETRSYRIGLEVNDMELIGSRLAAQILGWHPRRVRRHAEQLGGLLVGDRLMFNADTINAHAADQHQGDKDGRATA